MQISLKNFKERRRRKKKLITQKNMPFVKINKCIVMDREREVSCTYPTVLQCEIISKQRQ